MKAAKLFISSHSEPMLIKTSLQMYISKETAAGLGGMGLCNHKDISVIYLPFGSYPAPQQARPPHLPRRPRFITGTLYVPPYQRGRHMGPCLNFRNESFQYTISFRSYF